MQTERLGKLSKPSETVAFADYDDETDDAVQFTELIEMGRALHRDENFHGHAGMTRHIKHLVKRSTKWHRGDRGVDPGPSEHQAEK